MERRLFVDVESTGDGSSIQHDIIELHCRYYENEKLVSSFDAQYSFANTTVFQMNINWDKAHKNKEDGKVCADDGLPLFLEWLDTHIGNNRAFFIAYNCEWDFVHIKNWFKRNQVRKKYFMEPCICLMQVCACKYGKFLSLTNCATNLGENVDVKKLHTAKYDTMLAVNVYRKLITSLRAV